MKPAVFCCLLVFLLPLDNSLASGQLPMQLGSAGMEYGKHAACAADGNILFGILFQNTIDFDPSGEPVALGTPPDIHIPDLVTPRTPHTHTDHSTPAAGEQQFIRPRVVLP